MKLLRVSKKNINISAGIINQFAKLGYNMSVRVLSADHYGVAQRRRRSIFIGNKLGIENFFPEPTHVKKSRTVNDAFSDMRFDDVEHNHDIEAAQIINELEKKNH